MINKYLFQIFVSALFVSVIASPEDISGYIVLDKGKVIHGNVRLNCNLFKKEIIYNDSVKLKLEQTNIIYDGNNKYARVLYGFLPSYTLSSRFKEKDSVDFYKIGVIYIGYGLPFLYNQYYYVSINDNSAKKADYWNLKDIMKDNPESMKNLKINRDIIIAKWALITGGIVSIIIGINGTLGHQDVSPMLYIGFGSIWAGYICHFIAPLWARNAVDYYQ